MLKSYYKFMGMVVVILLSIGMAVAAYGGEGGAGLGVFSNGYRVGEITKFSVKGFAFKSGEGQMLMGRESTPYTSGTGENRKRVNPWYFSAESNDAAKIKPFAGQYAVIHYNEAYVKSPAYDTKYMVNGIEPIDRDATVPTCVLTGDHGAKSEGVRVGRIVKLSMKGVISETGEMMMQVGNAGNQFKHMSVGSDRMYACMLKVLKTAQKVKVTYAESWFHNPFGSDTGYTVLKVEPLSDI